jgi:hypothetical protein
VSSEEEEDLDLNHDEPSITAAEIVTILDLAANVNDLST